MSSNYIVKGCKQGGIYISIDCHGEIENYCKHWLIRAKKTEKRTSNCYFVHQRWLINFVWLDFDQIYELRAKLEISILWACYREHQCWIYRKKIHTFETNPRFRFWSVSGSMACVCSIITALQGGSTYHESQHLQRKTAYILRCYLQEKCMSRDMRKSNFWHVRTTKT